MSQAYSMISKHYLGEQGRGYFLNKFGSHMDFGRIFQSRFFLQYCRDDWTMLDFGCANGLFLRNLPARHKIGVEVNPTAQKVLQEVNQNSMEKIELHSRLDTVQSDLVDIVISNHCLEHTIEPFQTLKEILRVLRPGGIFVLIVPFDDYRNRKNKLWKPRDKDNHLYTWSPMNLGNLLQEAGFEVEQINIHTRAWSPKFFWVYHIFGECLFHICCYILGIYKSKREVFGKAKKPIY
jgi:SAM-dependent methyltransferase